MRDSSPLPGPIGRRIHRNERDDHRHIHANAVHDIARAEPKVAELADVANRLTAALPIRRAWERTYAPELDRLRTLTNTITERRLEAAVEHSVGLEHEVDHGISL